MARRRRGIVLERLRLDPRVRRALCALLAILLAGSAGYMLIEDWSFHRALFFTLISVSTVGYGDYGLSPAGERFTIILLLTGIGAMTYSLGQLVQAAVEYQLNPERKIMRQINRMHDHYIVCGLGRMGYAACVRLEQEGASFVCIDEDEGHVEEATERGWPAICGDATDDDVLERAGVTRCRGMLCVASSDTANIVITLTARGLNPELTIISRAEHDESWAKIRRAGATHVVSPTRAGGVRMAETLLSPELAELQDRVHDQHLGMTLAEFIVESGSGVDGLPLAEYGRRRPELVFIALVRDGAPVRIKPAGEVRLVAGDAVVVAGRPGDLLTMRADTSSRASPAPAAAA